MKAFRIVVIVIVVSFIGLFVWAKYDNWKNRSHAAEVAATQHLPIKQKTLNLDWFELRQQWNAVVGEVVRIESFKEPAKGGYTVDFGNNLAMLAGTSDSKVTNLLIIYGGGDGLGAIKLFGAMLGAIAVTNPSLSPTERGAILKRMKLAGDDEDYSKGKSESVTENGIEYAVVIKDFGLLFSATPK
ncbi:MAG: hypothetical protein Q8L39_04725 [Burkholderiales bacterium]|nr:hypothetical protein [Burkholderiales bacterium]